MNLQLKTYLFLLVSCFCSTLAAHELTNTQKTAYYIMWSTGSSLNFKHDPNVSGEPNFTNALMAERLSDISKNMPVEVLGKLTHQNFNLLIKQIRTRLNLSKKTNNLEFTDELIIDAKTQAKTNYMAAFYATAVKNEFNLMENNLIQAFIDGYQMKDLPFDFSNKDFLSVIKPIKQDIESMSNELRSKRIKTEYSKKIDKRLKELSAFISKQ